MVKVGETVINTMSIANSDKEPVTRDLEMTTGQKITLRKFDRTLYKIEEVEVEFSQLKSVEQTLRGIDDGKVEQLMKYLESHGFD